MNGIFTMNFLGDWINSFFQSVMLWFDSVIYWFAAQCYQLFMKLSMAQIFDNNFYNNFANRIYSILGVFMLFYLAYALLNALVDPEKLAKGDKSVSKLASNLVISLVILGLLPSIFEYAYRLQNYILSSNVIGSLVFGTPTIDVSDDNENSMIRYGDAISFTVLNTFLNSDNYNVRLGDSQKTWFDVKYEILHDGNYGSLTGLAKPIVEGANVVSGKNAGQEVYIVYKVVISTIAGVYLCYIMLSFTLDLGVRVAKLAFCQLVAPIPVIMRAMPGKKGTFDNWLKLTLSVFFEIFVRVAIMYISIYLINGLVESDMWSSFFSGGIQGMIALVIIIMGILTFAKQAPKMISDVLGIDSGSLKLGIGEKIKGSGLFQGIAKGAAVAGVGGAMIGAGVTGLVRNFGKNGIGKALKSDTASGVFKNLGIGALSGIAGATSGMFHAYTNPKNIKSIKDVKKQADIGTQKSTQNRENRANYIASHGNTIRGAMFGHVQDAFSGVKEWAGYTRGLDELKGAQTLLKNVSDSRKSVVDQLKFIRDTVEDGKRHVSFSYNDINGNSHTIRDAELGYLRQYYERLKATGADAEDMRNMELLLKEAEKQANKDIANGIQKDGRTPIANVSDYNAELKARINKLMTDINAANQTLSANVETNIKDLESAKNFTFAHRDDDVASLASSGVKVYEELVDKINKPSIEANGKINQEINKYIEKQEKKK